MPIDKSKLTKEMIKIAAKCQTAEELIALANQADIDMTEAIIQMSEWETTYQASLQVGARLMQTSLLDFIR